MNPLHPALWFYPSSEAKEVQKHYAKYNILLDNLQLIKLIKFL
jgi:hypothetical protein